MDEYKSIIEQYLADYFKPYEALEQYGLCEAMAYSLNAGGKRIRPILALEFCRISGGDIYKLLPAACGIEMLHTYSLIHDDLPCMDNDDYRRGKLTNHKVFGECTATLAGDALQCEAFRAILSADLPAENRAACAKELADAVGMLGMCGGQYLDTLNEDRDISVEELESINEKKTSALLIAACRVGVSGCCLDEEKLRAATEYGSALGRAFQIRDDILDVIGDMKLLGKPIGSDSSNKKSTYMARYGLERCNEIIDELTEKAKEAVSSVYSDTAFLCSLADELAKRDY